ncbi:iron complex transport system permease protein [Bhargavaea ginsengi]|uniref:Iron complex transport system permease protein n=1 Tax=Bhargavaea ginsengi TaxID=426757 RepID=A0A1H7AKD0_9BACL|nr:iron ABC transporter permease [Bhargavaea ginsengi]SEJ65376.1 iron complex transport system permease protein [Bhargavaea ginsengi]
MKKIRQRKTKQPATAYTVSAAMLLLALWLGVSVGSVKIPFHVLVDPEADEVAANILWNIRMPRVVLAGLVGGSLALAGAAFQGLLKNPLADPYTLGVSSGASVGAVATLFFGIGLFGAYTLPIFSMAGAMAVLLLVIGFARAVDRSLKMETIILTGVIFGSFLGSVLSLMIALTGEELRQIISWLLGSVSMRGWKYVWIILPFLLVGGLLLWLCRRELNAMLFGEERAHHLGVDVRKRKWMILGGGSILTGSAVAVSGTIGFVGLVVPHMTRILWGSDHRHLLPLSFINGASLLVLCDLVARTIISPTELPVGVITSFIGAPVFAFIFYRQRRKGAVRHA